MPAIRIRMSMLGERGKWIADSNDSEVFWRNGNEGLSEGRPYVLSTNTIAFTSLSYIAIPRVVLGLLRRRITCTSSGATLSEPVDQHLLTISSLFVSSSVLAISHVAGAARPCFGDGRTVSPMAREGLKEFVARGRLQTR